MRLIDADALRESVLKWLPNDPCGVEENEYPYETDICVSMLMEIEDAPTIEPEPHWIPCSERLPEEGTECLVTLLSYAGIPVISIDSYDYDGQDGWFTYMDRVVAWMPLPAPYMTADD